MGKTLVNTTNFPTSLGRGVLQGHVDFMISKIDVTLFDVTQCVIYVICLIDMQREGTVSN